MATNPPILALRNVRLTLGGDPLFTGVDLPLAKGQRVALVGRNGAGKSTLMRILLGSLEADDGERFVQPGTTIRHLAQEPDLTGFETALAYCSQNLEPDETYLAEAELHGWGVDPNLNPATASGGQARRIAMSRVFAEQPDILLLDEPTNHLDIEAIEQLEKSLLSFRGALLVVSHDRRFLENVSTHTAWLRQGIVRTLDRSYKHFQEWSEHVEDADERALDKLDTQLAAEERWMARGVTARRKRNMGRVRKLQDMRSERVTRKTNLNAASASATLTADSGTASSRLVIEAKNLSKSFDTPAGQLNIVNDLNLRIMRGDRIGLVGPNGVGKTTVLKLLLKQLEPTQGNLRLAKNLEIAFLDQTRTKLDPNDTLWNALAPTGGDQIMVRGHPKHVAAYAKEFLFSPAQLRQPVTALSGGERNRLTLAIALAKPSNLLVLDEPTNDLDIETLEMLEEMLTEYDGTLILVSHDRAFLDGVVTSVLTPEGNGHWLETPGGYSDYLSQRRTQAATKATNTKAQPPKQTKKPVAKLSYKHQHKLEQLEKDQAKLGTEITVLEQKLAEPSYFETSPDEFQKTAQRLEQAREELETAELEWLEIEELKADLEKK